MVKREKPQKNPERKEKPSEQHDIELYEIKVKDIGNLNMQRIARENNVEALHSFLGKTRRSFIIKEFGKQDASNHYNLFSILFCLQKFYSVVSSLQDSLVI